MVDIATLTGELAIDEAGRRVLRYSTPNIDTCGIFDKIMSFDGRGTNLVRGVNDYMMHVDIVYQTWADDDGLIKLDKKITKLLGDMLIEQNNHELFEALANQQSYSVYKKRILKIDTSWISWFDHEDRKTLVETIGGINAVDNVVSKIADKISVNPGARIKHKSNYDIVVTFKPDQYPEVITKTKSIIFNLITNMVRMRLREETASGT